MRTATLTTIEMSPLFTTGNLVEGNFSCATIEKAWLQNAPDISCIPRGITVLAKFVLSPRHGKFVYQLQDVDARSGIELDIANVAQQLLGCIGLGKEHATFKKDSLGIGIPSCDQTGVTYSADTMDAFEAHMRDAQGNQEDFMLVIK